MQGTPVPTKKLLKIEYLTDDRIYECDSGVLVNDVVYLDGHSVFQKSSNNNYATLPVLGVVRSKNSDTECQIQMIGERNGFSGIIPNTRYYLSTNGGITATPPSTEGVAIVPIGIGKNSSTIELRLNLLMVKN